MMKNRMSKYSSFRYARLIVFCDECGEIVFSSKGADQHDTNTDSSLYEIEDFEIDINKHYCKRKVKLVEVIS